MPELDTGASPNDDGTSPAGGKPESGNNPPGAGDGADSQSASPSITPSLETVQQELVTLKQNYSDSSRQEQASRMALQQANARIQQLEQVATPPQAAAAPVTQVAPGVSEVAKQLKEGIYDEDENVIAAALTQIKELGAAEQADRQNKDNAKAARMGGANAYFNQHQAQLNDANDPVTQKANQIYTQLLTLYLQGQYKPYIPQEDVIQLQTEYGTTVPINVHLYQDAHEKALGQAGTQAALPQPHTAANSPASPFLEPQNSGETPGVSNQGEQPEHIRLLNAGDKQTADAYFSDISNKGERYKKYWEHMDENTKVARQKLNRADIGPTEMAVLGK